MNVLSPPTARLSIEVVHDLVCPWCYLGLRRLLRALTRRPDILADLSFRPFLLNPDMPRAGIPRSDYMLRKFGGGDRAGRMQAVITELGLHENILFRFERIRRTPASVDAHRLVRFAARFGEEAAVIEAMFAAYFTDGRDIGDMAVLVSIAGDCGLPMDATAAFLASNDECELVHEDNLMAHRLGISGVPCFIIGGAQAISGAQEPEVIERLLDVALSEQIGRVTYG